MSSATLTHPRANRFALASARVVLLLLRARAILVLLLLLYLELCMHVRRKCEQHPAPPQTTCVRLHSSLQLRWAQCHSMWPRATLVC